MAIGLGSSLGDRRRALELAVRMLAAGPGLELLRVSRWVRTPPLAGGAARNWFLNGVALFRSGLDPEVILDRCASLEAKAGRRRSRHWGDRPLDIDLLLVEDRTVATPRLTLP
ncbi:MAG: 2-amino-4-hydroxy-6-hydroxymethyldihydropteridine diphosphokinase, partial [Myxococcota bacterium]